MAFTQRRRRDANKITIQYYKHNEDGAWKVLWDDMWYNNVQKTVLWQSSRYSPFCKANVHKAVKCTVGCHKVIATTMNAMLVTQPGDLWPPCSVVQLTMNTVNDTLGKREKKHDGEYSVQCTVYSGECTVDSVIQYHRFIKLRCAQPGLPAAIEQ